MACENENQETVDTRVECRGAEAPIEEVRAVGGENAEAVEPGAEAASKRESRGCTPASAELMKELFAKSDEHREIVAGIARRVYHEVRDMHRLYHTEFAGRLREMQEELDRYHEIDKGRVFDDILRELARLYSENIDVLESISDATAKKQLSYMFMDILQLLNNNGVHAVKTQPGEKRDTRHSRVMNREKTDDQQKNGTVVASHNVGFRVENRTLVDEMVDVYIYAHKPEDIYKPT